MIRTGSWWVKLHILTIIVGACSFGSLSSNLVQKLGKTELVDNDYEEYTTTRTCTNWTIDLNKIDFIKKCDNINAVDKNHHQTILAEIK